LATTFFLGAAFLAVDFEAAFPEVAFAGFFFF
jgi:hypothetical protein